MLEDLLHEVQVREIVLDVEDRGDQVRALRRRRGRLPQCHELVQRVLDEGQPDPEGASLAERAVDAQHAPHRLDQALGQGEPQSGPLDPGLLGAQAVEGAEQP